MIDAVLTLAERPDLVDAMWDMPTTWPPFMLEDPVADVWFERLPEVFGEYQLVALDVDGRVAGKVNSLPFAWSGRDDDLPARAWDAILERGFAEQACGIRPTAVSLLEARVVVHPWPSTSRAAGTTACRPTRGCASTSAGAGGSSPSARCP
jgi:hypothetical protein